MALLRSVTARRFLESVTAGVFRSTGDGLESPAQLPGLQLWCDGLDVSTITIATGVSQWADKSGLGHHLKQSTGANQPSYANGRLTFDGVNDFLKADAFTLAQPTTVYFVGSQVTWTSGDYLYDGGAVNTMGLQAITSTPLVRLRNGAVGGTTVSMTLATNFVATAVWSGAASGLRLNRGTATVDNMATTEANGFTLGVAGDTTSGPANITASSVLVYAAAHDTNTQNRVIQYLGRRYGIAV